ncbi:MAG: 50S ribosomal protein L29 [Bacteroidetes bacterium]|nr:50S ribosomal protein L29 [Bacteroidota bacterium]MDA1333463.1 50S ribosomal protein L29 [Bacteroidota bacterium]
MKAKEIRELSTEEIQTRISEEREQLAQLKFQHAIADLQNPLVLRHKRRLVAQLETILRERLEATAAA